MLGAAFMGSEVIAGVGEWALPGTVWRRNDGKIVVVVRGGFRRPTVEEQKKIAPLAGRMDRMDRRDKRLERRRRGYKDLPDTDGA